MHSRIQKVMEQVARQPVGRGLLGLQVWGLGGRGGICEQGERHKRQEGNDRFTVWKGACYMLHQFM